jgi:hypothetical protein
MEFELDTTAEYRRDLEALSSQERSEVTQKLARLIQMFKRDRRTFFTHCYRPAKPHLPGNLTSTVWVLRVTPKIQILFAYDEDPLFDMLKFSLLRIFNHHLRNGDFLEAAAQFYRSSSGMELEK